MGHITDGMKKECYTLGKLSPKMGTPLIPKYDIIPIEDLYRIGKTTSEFSKNMFFAK